ncbi:MAG: hypothetical protein Q7S68_06045 [Deltaproteobacteria bacterium]|nr:hypothetical protein [Deltaproteobacteria bacterium]
MFETGRIRRQTTRLRNLFKEKSRGAESAAEGRLLVRASENEEFTFENGLLLLNGMELLSLVDEDAVDVELLDSLMSGVSHYRREVWSRYGTQYRDFNAATQVFLEKGSKKLGNCYEEMSGGLRVRLSNGRLWINEIDPKVVLQLFLSNPSPERRQYLKSILRKLTLILEGKAASSKSHDVCQESKRLTIQIEKALEHTAADSSPPLLVAFAPLGR